MTKYPQDLSGEDHKLENRIISLNNDLSCQLTPIQQIFSALAGAITTVLAVSPADVMKTRMQLQPSQYYLTSIDDRPRIYIPRKNKSVGGQLTTRGFIETFKAIKEYQGLRGFYSGLTISLITTMPATVLYFVAYEQFKAFYTKNNKDSEFLPDLTYIIPLLSGISSRSLLVSVYSPLDMVRVKMQANKMSYGQVFKVIRNIVKTNGVPGLWYGFTPMLLRDTPFTAIYWTVYETLKIRNLYHQEMQTFLFSFLSGATAGTIAATVTTPLDVVATRSHVAAGQNLTNADSKKMVILSPSYIIKQLFQIYRLEGLKGLFAGLSLRLFKVVPSCAIMISVFELGKHYFITKNKKKSENLT